MVERFNGRINDVLQSHHFVSGEDLAQTLYRYALLYNQQLPQSTLGSKTPLDAMQRWYESHPHLFVKRPCNLAGGDTFPPHTFWLQSSESQKNHAIRLSNPIKKNEAVFAPDYRSFFVLPRS